MDNQQIPKADSKFQKIARKNHRRWKLRLLSKGGQKANSGGGPYNKKPDYNRAKSAPPGFGGSLQETEQLDEVIRKKGDKYCLFSKKTKRNLGCYPTRAGAMKRERQVQYFKHLKETIIREELRKVLIEEGILDDIKEKGSELYNKFISMFSGEVKPSANMEELVSKYNLDPKTDLSLNRKQLQEKFGGFEGYIEFLWKMFDENKSSLSGWSRDKTINLIKQLAPKYGIEPYIVIGTMMGESGGMPVGIYSQTMGSTGNPQAAISANSTAYGIGQIVHSTYESIKNEVGVPHYMIWIPEYGIEATIALLAKLIKQRGSLEAAMASYAGSAAGGERKLVAIEKAKEQYGSLSESKKKGKDDRCVRIAKSKYDAWPSAYASGAVVKCRQGKIWKNIKEEEELDEEKKLKRKLKKGIASALSAMTAVLPPPDAIQSAKGKRPSEIIKKDKEELEEEWSDKYKRSIDCKNPKGFSQRAHCQGRKKNEGRDPKQGTGKKPKGSGRRLYTDENPKDTVGVKFSTAEDIRDTLSKESFKSKSHARQSQIINLIHQRVRAAHENAKDPETKARLKIALDYAEKRKEASKKKTASLQKEEILTEKCWPGYTQKGMKTMFGKKYPNCVKKTNEEIELEERKLGKPSSETSLRDWFKRKGAPGKRGGWVDCNTCRNGKCSPCGRQGGEKRSKYPRCRPTPSQCKGYKRRGDNLQREE